MGVGTAQRHPVQEEPAVVESAESGRIAERGCVGKVAVLDEGGVRYRRSNGWWFAEKRVEPGTGPDLVHLQMDSCHVRRVSEDLDAAGQSWVNKSRTPSFNINIKDV